jgi:hypothetical protein
LDDVEVKVWDLGEITANGIVYSAALAKGLLRKKILDQGGNVVFSVEVNGV